MALKSNNKLVQPAWRPNFRDVQALPDIKVIRTDFLLNFIFLTLLVGAGALYAMKELQIRERQELQAELNAAIEQLQSGDREFIRLDKEFQGKIKSLEELAKFADDPLAEGRLFVDLAKVQPAEVVLSSLSIAPRLEGKTFVYTVSLNGTVTESARPAATIINEYREQLATIPQVEGRLVDQPQLSSFSRDDKLGVFSFGVTMNIKGIKDQGGAK